MIISINGKPGSGKSSVAKAIEREFGLKRYYMGGLRREMARKKGITLEELNELGEKDFSTDQEVDDYQKKLGETEGNFVIEGRTSFFLIPQSFKIFLDVSVDEGAKRIWSDLQKNAEKRNEASGLDSYEDVVASVEKRIASDIKRYDKYYQQNIFDKSKYDLWLDTTEFDLDQVKAQVFEAIRKQNSNNNIPSLSPK